MAAPTAGSVAVTVAAEVSESMTTPGEVVSRQVTDVSPGV
jgi:hypothetical protein